MFNTNAGVAGYSGESARAYDNSSLLDKGDRERHKCVLKDLLHFLTTRPRSFVELGCGTGFFTEAIFETFPGIKGVLIDGSADMLAVAKTRFRDKIVNADFRLCLFQDVAIDGLLPAHDLVFSSLAVHHLPDEQKWELFGKIYKSMPLHGCFILYDIFKHTNPKSWEILEFLACKDMQRRLLAELQIDTEIEELHIDQIIQNDRKMRREEGDQEADLKLILRNLETAGFINITVFLQEARFVGVICFKN